MRNRGVGRSRVRVAALMICVFAMPVYAQEVETLELGAVYDVIECRDAHRAHVEVMRSSAERHCRDSQNQLIKWFSYRPKHCRYKTTKGRPPVEVEARVTFACMSP
ncbi:MAG: hypothetical protein R3E83_01820 [Burkholderiaceae bacterium]